MVKEEIRDNGFSRSALDFIHQCLHYLYKENSLERYTPEELVENCMRECDDKNMKNILGCWGRGRCDKNIYPRRLMEELNPKKYKAGFRKKPYVYKLKDKLNYYGAY